MRKSKGFSLVELLVVMGIISLLISILLPSISRSRESARSVKCLSNLRQIGQATQMYLHENKGSFFLRALNDGPNPDDNYATLFRFVGSPGENPYNGNANPYKFGGNKRYLNQYLNTSDTNDQAVWICPTDPGLYKFTGTSYGANLFVKKTATEPDVKGLALDDLQSIKVTQIKNSSSFVVAAEHGANQLAWLNGGSTNELGKISGVQVLTPAAMFWHSKSRTWNVLFADGHCGAVDIKASTLSTSEYTYNRE